MCLSRNKLPKLERPSLSNSEEATAPNSGTDFQLLMGNAFEIGRVCVAIAGTGMIGDTYQFRISSAYGAEPVGNSHAGKFCLKSDFRK